MKQLLALSVLFTVSATVASVVRPKAPRPGWADGVPLSTGTEVDLAAVPMAFAGCASARRRSSARAAVPDCRGKDHVVLSDHEMDEHVRPLYENLDPRVRARLLVDLAKVSERMREDSLVAPEQGPGVQPAGSSLLGRSRA